MKQSYFPKDGVWLKGNLHSHSTVSDGSFEPEALSKAYADKGYDFLSMTDHNIMTPHSEIPEDELILIMGTEHDIEYSVNKCTHVVGIASADRGTTSYICRRYSKDELDDQGLVDMMHNDGQFIILAHPVWSRMEPEEVFNLENLNAVEVFNNGTEHLCHGGNAELLWDYMLRRGMKIFAMAGDDVHVPDDLFGGWIYLKAAERNKSSIMEALYKGSFYATTGPAINDFGIEDGKVYVECSKCREIHFVSYERRGKSYFAEQNLLSKAEFKLDGSESYCRAVCVDENGHSAWTQAIFFG